MGEKREYRSAARSRKLIRQAFFELLKEKPLEKVTVTDIVSRAEINRSTFYAHYPDVMGVVEEIQNEIFLYAQNTMAQGEAEDFFENPLPLLNQIVSLGAENIELYRLISMSILGMQQMEKLKKMLIDRAIETIVIPEGYEDTFQFEFSIRFFMGGIVDVYIQWLKGEMDCSVEVLTEQLARMIKRSNEAYMAELKRMQEE